MASDLPCDQSTCPNPAVIFGFPQAETKLKVCSEHVMTLISKCTATYDIGAYGFVESVRDVQVYEERKEMMKKGLEAVDAMEKRCEEEWNSGQQRLQASSDALYEVFLKTYEAIWLKGKKRYEKVKQDLMNTRSRLQRLLDKGYKPSAKDLAMCQETPSGPLFRMVIGDCRVSVMETITSSFHLLPSKGKGHVIALKLKSLYTKQVKSGRFDVAHEISQYAQERGFVCIDDDPSAVERYREEVKQQILSVIGSDEEVGQFATGCLRTGLMHIQKGSYPEAITEFQKGKNRLHLRALNHSELWLQLSNSLAESYHQTEQFAKCETECEEILATYGKHVYAYELWRALFLLIDSLYHQKQDSKGEAVYEEWVGKLPKDTAASHCMSVYTQANLQSWKGKDREAVALYENGLERSREVIPRSYITAWCYADLGDLYGDAQNAVLEEQQYVAAGEIYRDMCPFSISACNCLNNLGDLYIRTEKYALAEEKLLLAYPLLSSRYQDSRTSGLCQYNLGLVCRFTKRKQEAVKLLKDALPLLKQHQAACFRDCEKHLHSLTSN